MSHPRLLPLMRVVMVLVCAAFSPAPPAVGQELIPAAESMSVADRQLLAFLTQPKGDVSANADAVHLVERAQVITLYYEMTAAANEQQLRDATNFALSLNASAVEPVTFQRGELNYPQLVAVFSRFFHHAQFTRTDFGADDLAQLVEDEFGTHLRKDLWPDEMRRPISEGYKLKSVDIVFTPGEETRKQSRAQCVAALRQLAADLAELKSNHSELSAFDVRSVKSSSGEPSQWDLPSFRYLHGVGLQTKKGREKLRKDWCEISLVWMPIKGDLRQPVLPTRRFPLQGIEAIWTVRSADEELNNLIQLRIARVIDRIETLERKLQEAANGN